MESELGFSRKDRGTPRQFGLLMAAVLLLLGAWALWRGHAVGWLFLAAAPLLGGTALAAPERLQPLERGWMRFAERLGRVGNVVILSLFFVLVLTPFGLALRLLGRDRLRLRDRSEPSYWKPLEDPERSTYHDPF